VIAIRNLNDFREKEGTALGKDLLTRAAIIEKLLEEVPPLEGKRIEVMRER